MHLDWLASMLPDEMTMRKDHVFRLQSSTAVPRTPFASSCIAIGLSIDGVRHAKASPEWFVPFFARRGCATGSTGG